MKKFKSIKRREPTMLSNQFRFIRIKEIKDNRLNRREIISLAFNFISFIALGIPIWLFYLQQKSQIGNERAKLQVEIYSQATTELHYLLNNSEDSRIFDSLQYQILYKTFPKVVLLTDTTVSRNFEKINDVIRVYSIIKNFFPYCDSLSNLLSKFNMGLRGLRVPEFDGYYQGAVLRLNKKQQQEYLYYLIDKIHTLIQKIFFKSIFITDEIGNHSKNDSIINNFGKRDSLLLRQLILSKEKIFDGIYYEIQLGPRKYINLDFSRKNLNNDILQSENDSVFEIINGISQIHFDTKAYLNKLVNQLDSTMTNSNELLFRRRDF